MKPVAGMT